MQDSSLLYKFYYEWWKNIDKSIFSLVILLFFLGLFFSLVSTSFIASDKLNTNSYYFFFKHMLYILIGFFFVVFFSALEQKHLFKVSIFLFFTCFIFLLLVPIIGVEVKGSKRWLDLFFLPRFQPIELLKPFIIVIIASVLSSESNRNIYYKYFLSFMVLVPIIFLLITQPDVGQTFLVLLTWLSLIFISGINLVIFFLFFGLTLILLLYLIFFIPKFAYILIRLKSFFDPSSGNNYQSEKASEAIINGGFFGKGIGEGILKNRVPEAHTDYIVSVISEEFGAIIVITLMVIFLFFIYQVFKKLYYEKDDKIKLILVGSISIILFQTLIHIGVNIRLFPTTGMTLPFLSYGGSSIVGTAIISGIILNLTKRKINN
jgi:cell division protein FtsW